MTHTSLTADQARAAALRYVRGMLARGYDTTAAAREEFSSFSGPGEPGWEIRRGKIRVPCFGPDTHTFRFSELEAAIRRGQAAEQLALF